jgi:branched-chain amino acid transport system ATP-binding protein
VYYGSIRALSDVSMDVKKGEITILIGANGAGKTTLLKSISGVAPVRNGKITMGDVILTGMLPQKIVELGVAHVPEGRHVFAEMTTQDNLMLGAFIRKEKDVVKRELEEVFSIFPKLWDRRKQLAGTLSGGEQQMVAMGRALMLNPKLLLLDEPSMGLAPIVVEDIFNIILKVKAQGKTILLIEQNAQAALDVAQTAYVLENGCITLSGKGSELAADSRVKEAYLGL